MDSTAIENEPGRFPIIINAAKPRYPSTNGLGGGRAGLGMIRPVMTNVTKMRLLDGIRFIGSD
jgi:hypothetical protein